MKRETVLSVENLKVNFKVDGEILNCINDISFNIEEGQIVGMLGESGCGKSITAEAIMGLLKKEITEIQEGSVRLLGKELLTLSNKELEEVRGKEISMIFQEPMTSLNPLFTIGYQLGEGLRIHKGLKGKENREECIRLLREVSIPSPERVIDDYPHNLSGGMRQRVMIAMAISNTPKLLIADEPTTALDVTIQAQILQILKSINSEKNMAILLITHDLGVVLELCQEVIVLYSGVIVEKNTTEGLFKNPLHPYTKGLIGAMGGRDLESGRFISIEGAVPSLKERETGCPFKNRCSMSTHICKSEMPELILRGDKHSVRCHLYGGDNNE